GPLSPLLMMGTMMMTSAAVTVVEPRWLRGAVFLMFLVGFVALALLSRSVLGGRAPPLAEGTFATPLYVSLVLLACVFSMMGMYRMGCTMTAGYEQAAMEVAERREELCSAN